MIFIIKELKIRTKKIRNNYISECEVLDTETNEKFYVVTKLGDLYYGTYKSSYLDYALGETTEMPIQVEGNNYLWFDINVDRGDTKFFEEYNSTYCAASTLQHRDYINHKYARLKKSVGNIQYKILRKQSNPVFGCGPMGDIYEIEFLILPENQHLFACVDDAFSIYSIFDYSTFDAMEAENNGQEVDYKESIEEFNEFSKTKKSKYYDLYLELEKFRDNYDAYVSKK